MAFKIIISDEAKIDLEHAYLYYRTKASKKVADQFFKAFRSSIDIISKNPYFKIWFNAFRAKPMKKYPFLLFYTIDEEQKIIVVARIFHASQNPEKYP